MSDVPNPVFRQLTPDLESVTEAINDTESLTVPRMFNRALNSPTKFSLNRNN